MKTGIKLAEWMTDYPVNFAGHILSQAQPEFKSLRVDEHKQFYTYPKHIHPDYETLFIVEGTYKCHLNKELLVLQPGELLLVKPGDIHQDICQPQLRYYCLPFVIHPFNDSSLDLKLLKDNLKPQLQVFSFDQSIFLPLLEHIIDNFDPVDMALTHLRNARLLVIFWELVKIIPKASLATEFRALTQKNNFIITLYQVFEKYINEDCSVDAIARQMGMSASLLTKKCRDNLAETPAACFNIYKINQAKQLLLKSSVSIQEISFQLGFSNQYHFSRVFKKIAQLSPRQYRQKFNLK